MKFCFGIILMLYLKIEIYLIGLKIILKVRNYIYILNLN